MRAIARGASRGAARRLPRTAAGRRRILACACGPLVARSRRAFAPLVVVDRRIGHTLDDQRFVIGHPGMQGAAVDTRRWLAGLQPVATLAPRVIIPGHGKPARRAAEAIAFDGTIRFACGADLDLGRGWPGPRWGRWSRTLALCVVIASRRWAAWRSRAWSRMFVARPWIATDPGCAGGLAMTGFGRWR